MTISKGGSNRSRESRSSGMVVGWATAGVSSVTVAGLDVGAGLGDGIGLGVGPASTEYPPFHRSIEAVPLGVVFLLFRVHCL